MDKEIRWDILSVFFFRVAHMGILFAPAGPIFRINMAGQNVVVVGSHKIATELFDRRSQIYSDRARNIVAGELLCGGLIIAFSQHNDIWKRMRRGAHE